MNRRSLLQVVGVAVLVLAVAIVIGRPDSDGPPLDPDSVGELGTRGLVEFLERSGSEVRRGLPGDDVDVVLVLQDRLDGGQREAVLDWIQRGGEAVIADPTSPLVAAGLIGIRAGDELERGPCDASGLEDVERLDGGSLGLLEPVPRSTTCFGDASGAYVVQFPDGAGTVTALGGAIPLTNAHLDQADNAVLAGRLLLGSGLDGSLRAAVTIIYSPISSPADTVTLADLIGSNVRWFGWQLAVTALLGLLWAIRRFGRVVPEAPVVELPGSLAVRATAELHRRSRSSAASLDRIRRSVQSRIRDEYRLPADVTLDQTAANVAQRTGLSIDEVRVVTATEASGDDPDAAVAAARRIDELGRRVLADAAPARSPSSRRQKG